MSDWPRITIITPSYNQGQFLEETMLSVFNQRYPNLEYLVADGGSTDQSLEIIWRYADRLSWWVSERDRGQSHALNKALEWATGDIVAFLNSDDVYLPGALYTVAQTFQKHPDWNWLAGGWLMFGNQPGDETSWAMPRVPANAGACVFGDFSAAQPGHFWRRKLFEEHGNFEESYHYCFDHDFYVRLMLAGERCHPVASPLAGYRLHASSKSVSEEKKFFPEWEDIRRRYSHRLPEGERLTAEREHQLKESFAECCRALQAMEQGDRDAAWSRFAGTVFRCPTSLSRRFGWGCLRRLWLG